MESLYVIWAFSRNLTFDLNFPNDINLPNKFKVYSDIDRRRYHGLPEFELEFLTKQIILHSSDRPTTKSLKDKRYMAKLVNYSRRILSEGISEITTKNQVDDSDFLIEFHRMAHRQFKWQTGYNQNIIFRYYKIYSDPDLDGMLKAKFNLDTYHLFLICFFLFRHTANYFKIPYPLKSDSELITEEMLETFFENFSAPISELKNDIKKFQEMNENLYYSYNPLLSKPILIYEEHFLCPMHLLLFWRLTGGIYYSIVGEKGFENAFGKSFENYTGEILKKALSPKFKIYPEETYGKPEKKTCDWIITDNDAVLFIECKTKRMTIKSKTQLDIKAGLENDIKKMADFVVQIYRSYLDFEKGFYPNLAHDKEKDFIPLILTLENWYISLNPKVMDILHKKIEAKFDAFGMDKNLLTTFPYNIKSSEEFESDIQLIEKLGLKEYFDLLEKNEIQKKTKDFEFDFLFGNEFKTTFIEPIQKYKKKTGSNTV